MRLLIIILCVISYSVTAQNYKFGKVSKEELEEKFNPTDSSASATYLYKNRHTYFDYVTGKGFQLITEVHDRIKIYTNEGFDYATKEINLYKTPGEKEEMRNLKAVTYNLEGNKIEAQKITKNGIFESEISKIYNQAKFTLPNLKSGTVIEYKYKIVSPFYFNVDEFQFQHDIPIKYLVARFEAPEYFNFKENIKGFVQLQVKEEELAGEIKIKSQKDNLSTSNYKRVTQSLATSSKRNSDFINEANVEFIKKVKSYELSDIPALKDESFVDNIDNYRSAIKYELSYTQFPQSPPKYYTSTWEDVVRTIYESQYFGAELNKSGYYKDEVDALVAGITDPLKKAALIYNHVKSNVQWNGYYGKYTDQGVRKAYKEHSGNVAEINLMLTSMLRYAGLNADPVLISTRSNGVPFFPTREGYNYVISAISHDNGTILLDATNTYGAPNILPTRTLNWKGRIIKKDGNSRLVNLYPSTKSKNTTIMMADLLEDGAIEGAIRTVRTNHLAMNFRQSYIGADKDDYLEKMQNRNGGIEISDFTVKNEMDLAKPVMESYKFKKENQFELIGDKMYISPMFFMAIKENPFKLEKRDFAVNFSYPTSSKYNITIKIPEGYKVESTPEPKILQLPEGLGEFKYNIAASDKSIQLTIESEMNNAVISNVHYKALKDYYKEMIEVENEKIVLTKL